MPNKQTIIWNYQKRIGVANQEKIANSKQKIILHPMNENGIVSLS